MNKKLYRIYEKLNNRNVLSKLNELEIKQWFSTDELALIQESKLVVIINLAVNNVTYYQSLKDELEINIINENTIRTLLQLYILNKEKIINNYNRLTLIKEQSAKRFQDVI